MTTESTESDRDDSPGESVRVWLLVARTARRPAVEAVADELRGGGIRADVVAITDVIGSAAREAVAGGAERILRSLRVAWGRESTPEHFLDAVRRERPDMLVVCSPRYVRPLSLVESLTGAGALQVGLPLDFSLPDPWTEGSIDAFVVPHGPARSELEQRGWGGERLRRAGPPLLPTISLDWDRAEVLEDFGLSSDERTVVVRADSFAPDHLEKFVFQATLVDEPFRFLFHHNGDGAIADALRRAADEHGLPASMFGRVPDLGRYLVAADFVVAPPSDPFLPEIVALRRPLMLVGRAEAPDRQVEVLTGEYGAAHVPDVLRASGELESFGADESLEAAGETELSPGNGPVADALRSVLEQVDRRRTRSGGLGEPTAGPDDEREARTGPFESIGAGDSTDAAGSRVAGGASGEGGPDVSRAEAEDQLAELILEERRLERRLSELEREQERWRNRLELARDWGEDELAAEAESLLRDYIDEAEEIEADLESIREQKARLKRAAGREPGGAGTAVRGHLEGGTSDPDDEVEERFSEMELERDLDDLRDEIDDELDE
ncbi:MAG: hypothetical protein ABEL76_11625 [Bradymonadaceae bacterium]